MANQIQVAKPHLTWKSPNFFFGWQVLLVVITTHQQLPNFVGRLMNRIYVAVTYCGNMFLYFS